MESPWQTLIPDSLLLDVFSYLGIPDLGNTAQVCKQWARVGADNSLWHELARQIWKINSKYVRILSDFKNAAKQVLTCFLISPGFYA